MKKDEKEKYYLTYIKSAQSTVALSLLLNLIFIIRTFFAKNTDFLFSLYSTEFALESSGFLTDNNGTMSELSAIIIILAGMIPLTSALILAAKNAKHLSVCHIFYVLDFAFLVYGLICNPLSEVTDASYINLIFHLLNTLLICVGIYGERKIRHLSKN